MTGQQLLDYLLMLQDNHCASLSSINVDTRLEGFDACRLDRAEYVVDSLGQPRLVLVLTA